MASEMSSLTLAKLCQSAINILVVLLFVLLVMSAYHHFAATGSTRFLGILVVNLLFLGLFVTRRAATAETDSLPLWLLAVAGTACPLLLRPSDGAGLMLIGSVIQITGILFIACGLLSLRRSFAVVPGNRGIRDGGLYRVVRHPIYLVVRVRPAVCPRTRRREFPVERSRLPRLPRAGALSAHSGSRLTRLRAAAEQPGRDREFRPTPEAPQV